MTRDEIVQTLTAVERHLAHRVAIVRIVVNASGQQTGQRIYRGSFNAPPNWTPPKFDALLARAKGGRR